MFKGITKGKIVFFLVLLVSVIVLASLSYFIRGKLPERYNDWPTDIIASLALVVAFGWPAWDRFFPHKPKKSYHLAVHRLEDGEFNPLTLKVRISNDGEVDVNINFAWLESPQMVEKLYGMVRFEFDKIYDSRKQEMDSNVTITPGTTKTVYVEFVTKDPLWDKTLEALGEAYDKRDIRLINVWGNYKARLCWGDASDKNAEQNIPLGAWFVEAIKEDIANSSGAVHTRR